MRWDEEEKGGSEKMRVGTSLSVSVLSYFRLSMSEVEPTIASFSRIYFPFSFGEILNFRGNILFEFSTASTKAFVALSIEDNSCSHNWFEAIFTFIQSVLNTESLLKSPLSESYSEGLQKLMFFIHIKGGVGGQTHLYKFMF